MSILHSPQLLLGACLLLGGCSTTASAPTRDGATPPAGGSATGDGLAGAGGAAGAGTNSENGPGAGGDTFMPAAIDFRFWELQLPIGTGTSPQTISSSQLLAGFSNEYFYLAADGGQAFMDPAAGVTTSGSQHCRTEMREQAPGAGKAAWPSSGTHSVLVEGKVVKLGSGSVAVGQLFNATDSIPLCELEYTTGQRFSLLYEEAKGAGTSTDLKTPVALDTRYTFTLSMKDGKLSVSINDQEVYAHTPSPGILANQFYFKVGNYDQSSTAGTPSTTPNSIVETYKVDVVHR